MSMEMEIYIYISRLLAVWGNRTLYVRAAYLNPVGCNSIKAWLYSLDDLFSLSLSLSLCKIAVLNFMISLPWSFATSKKKMERKILYNMICTTNVIGLTSLLASQDSFPIFHLFPTLTVEIDSSWSKRRSVHNNGAKVATRSIICIYVKKKKMYLKKRYWIISM